MGRRAEEVKRDIAQTRGELGSTLEAIGDRMAPKKVVARAKDDVSGRVEDVRDRISPTRRLRAGLRRARSSVMGGGEISPAGRDISTYDGGPDTSTRDRRVVEEGAGELSERVGVKAGSLAERARQVPSPARSIGGNPWGAGLVAFGAGFLAASVLPQNQRERQLTGQLKERVQPLLERATDTGRQVAAELQETAKAGAEQVQQRASEAAQQLKEEGEERAGRTRTRAERVAEEVKDEAGAATTQIKRQAEKATSQVKGQTRSATGQVKGQAKTASSRVKGETKVAAQRVKGEANKRSSPKTRKATTPRTRRTAGAAR